MARISNIKLRRSATAGAIPTTSNLDLGELALNTYDGKLYMKKSVGGTDSIQEIGASSAGAADIVKYFRYVATSTQTSFSGSDSNSNTLTYVVSAIDVHLNGILLDPSQDYTANNGSTVVLTSGATVGDILQITAYYRTIGTGDDVVQAFTGDGSAYSFTLSTNPIDENQTLIYIDGVYQNKSAYTVSGTTLSFGSGNAPASGAVIEVVTHSSNLTATNIADLTITGDFTTNTISASGTITGNLTGNVTGNTSGSAGTVTSLSGHDTDDLSEGSSNLYYTTARFNSALASANSGSLSEGSNLYYTDARVNSYLSTNNFSTQSYVDTAEADAIVSANTYTDTRETAITTAYQSYADQAEADAESAAAADATSKANAAQAAAIAAVTNGAGAAFDTLKEIQDAMATDSELSSAISSVTSSAASTAAADATTKADAAQAAAIADADAGADAGDDDESAAHKQPILPIAANASNAIANGRCLTTTIVSIAARSRRRKRCEANFY